MAHDVGVVFTAGSVVVSFAVFLFLRRRGKGLDSTLRSMEARAWLYSGYMGAALSASFGAAVALETAGRADLAAYADPVVLLALSVSLSPYPIRELLGTGRGILQIAPPELDARVAAIVRKIAERHGFAGHRS